VLAENGARVVLGDVQTEKVKAAAASIERAGAEAWGGFLDVSHPARVNRFMRSTIARFGGIDILINNAGIDAPTGQAWSEADKHWQEIIDVDLSGSWWCTKAVLNHMIAARRGRIVFISSVAARRGSAEISVAYNAAKAGLLGLTVALATQVEQHGVLVNAIAAGPTGTSGRPTQEESGDHHRVFPLGLGGTDPVAHACLYLVSRSGDWVSGSVMNVSGGAWKG
jgi:NAD(P)-dependent dehydrogenase (short-subunit alcohol dehydrogenase family)